ncbi:unnamed protein product, partial [Nesidiocoris tenuis]
MVPKRNWLNLHTTRRFHCQSQVARMLQAYRWCCSCRRQYATTRPRIRIRTRRTSTQTGNHESQTVPIDDGRVCWRVNQTRRIHDRTEDTR